MSRPAAETPMQEQYRRLKAECGDALLFFRLGDFYELFGPDAERAAPLLEVVLTSREQGPGLRVPMCGVPHHALTTYLARLLGRGHTVAIAEQVEDPALARGLVRREIRRVLTPGTVMEPELLDALGETLLAGVSGDSLAVVDASTGTVRIAELGGEADAATSIEQELERLRPREIVVPAGAVPACVARQAAEHGTRVTERPASEFAPEGARDLWPDSPASPALAGLLAYLRHTLRGALGALCPPEVYRPSAFVALDPAAQRNLELLERLGDGGASGTLFSTLDRAVTAMGRRLLRFWVLHPLRDPEAIRRRQDAVEELARRPLFREGLRAGLRGVYDLERLCARTLVGQATPRELAALGASLRALPGVLGALEGCGSPLLQGHLAEVDPLQGVGDLLGRALAAEPPAAARDGGIIAAGYDAALDELRAAGAQGRRWLGELEGRERERTGVRGLKVGFHRVLGYYLEVAARHSDALPPEYQRKQSTASAGRFVTDELRALEERILGADERALRREQALFVELRAEVAACGEALRRTAGAIAALDALAALADTAARRGWVRPLVDRSRDLVIREGRHPVLEQSLGGGRFVPNDLELGPGGRRLLLITGPNMAGKSTFMRQVALIAILAHMGSFVPATSARIGLVDRILTRVGASDDLFGGRSTFMVEMTEVAACLRRASPRSLLLLDEVGRGTSTRDGLAIAWAVAEDLARRVRARTLFATHYHELTSAVDGLPGAGNAHAAVREDGEGVVFLHRVVPGPTDRSYGLAVAQLAGVPPAVIGRARALLSGGGLEAAAPAPQTAAPSPPPPAGLELLRRLAALDPLRLTPLQALDLLAVLQAEASTLELPAGPSVPAAGGQD